MESRRQSSRHAVHNRGLRLLVCVLICTLLASCLLSVVSLSQWSSQAKAEQTHTLPRWPNADNPAYWPALQKMIQYLPVGKQGALLYDTRTLVALEHATQAMHRPLTPDEQARTYALRVRTFSAETATAIELLWQQYQNYQVAIAQQPGIALPALQQLQADHFGEHASSLFRQHNLMQAALQQDMP